MRQLLTLILVTSAACSSGSGRFEPPDPPSEGESALFDPLDHGIPDVRGVRLMSFYEENALGDEILLTDTATLEIYAQDADRNVWATLLGVDPVIPSMDGADLFGQISDTHLMLTYQSSEPPHQSAVLNLELNAIGWPVRGSYDLRDFTNSYVLTGRCTLLYVGRVEAAALLR